MNSSVNNISFLNHDILKSSTQSVSTRERIQNNADIRLLFPYLTSWTIS